MVNVSPWRRIGYAAIDAVIYTTATIWLAALLGGGQLPIGFMSKFTAEQQATYWHAIRVALVLVTVASVLGHAIFGRTIGKWLSGAKTVMADERPLGIAGALRRLIYPVALAAAIFLPGPLVGFAFGPGSESASLVLLFAGLIAIPVLAIAPFRPDQMPLLQSWFGVRTVEAPRWPV